MSLAPLSRLGLAALTYSAEYGMPVFPLHSAVDGRCSCGRADCPKPAKHPRIGGGFKNASSHPEQVCAWWDQWPDANIGFCPGTMDWLVLDLDGPTADARASTLGLLDLSTLGVRTARGRHLYFGLPKGVTIGNGSPWAADGIDIRSANGYVVLPPSVHASGLVYEWDGALE